MPGSKTYTSNKVNELLEAEFLEGMNDFEKVKMRGFSKTVFWEVIKISLSLLIANLIQLLTLTKNSADVFGNTANLNDTLNLAEELKVIITCLALFIFIYFVLSMLAKGIIWVYDAIFNLRGLSSEKKKAYWIFHKKIINHIYLGISFENKYNHYIQRASKAENDLNFDLSMHYLSQSVHYFEIAQNELKDLIPKEVTNKKKESPKNAEYLAYVGYPLICVTLVSAQRSLNRLQETKEKVEGIIEEVEAKDNKDTIVTGFSVSETSLFNDIKRYIDKYNFFLKRTQDLQKVYQIIRK